MAWRWVSGAQGGARGFAKASWAEARADAVGCAICMQKGTKRIDPPDAATVDLIWKGLERQGWVIEEVTP